MERLTLIPVFCEVESIMHRCVLMHDTLNLVENIYHPGLSSLRLHHLARCHVILAYPLPGYTIGTIAYPPPKRLCQCGRILNEDAIPYQAAHSSSLISS